MWVCMQLLYNTQPIADHGSMIHTAWWYSYKSNTTTNSLHYGYLGDLAAHDTMDRNMFGLMIMIPSNTAIGVE